MEELEFNREGVEGPEVPEVDATGSCIARLRAQASSLAADLETVVFDSARAKAMLDEMTPSASSGRRFSSVA